jgi:hypothetical protein
MVKAGIYRTSKPHIVYEKHGGANVMHEVYWNLCFYEHSNEVGLFGADKGFTQPYVKKSFDLKGQIMKSIDNLLELYVLNPYTDIKKVYIGSIKEDHLYLKYYHENNPEEVFEDVFEYIGTGESA